MIKKKMSKINLPTLKSLSSFGDRTKQGCCKFRLGGIAIRNVFIGIFDHSSIIFNNVFFNGTLKKFDDFVDDNNSFRIYVKSCVGSFSRRRRNASDDRRRSEVVVVVVPKFGKKIPGAFISAATTTAASCFDFTHM